MKIGIITFWESNDNYGQILQSFALQRYLRGIGHDAFVIRYKKPYIPIATQKLKIFMDMFIKVLKVYPVFNFLYCKYYDKFIYKTAEKSVVPDKLNNLRHFEDFRKQNIKYSPIIYETVEQLKNDEDLMAECLITGSDQVWHYSFLCKKGSPYFLDFGHDDVKRLSYAPSFGVKDFPMEKASLLVHNLKRFNAISIREKAGKEICDMLGFKSKIVIDPTILLLPEDYEKMLENSLADNTGYLYILNIKSPMDIGWLKIETFLKRHNIKAMVTNATGGFPAKEWFPGVDYQYSTIPQWLGNIKYSKVFLTTSFHGVVFAILLHANFVFVPIKVKSANTRAESLLSSLGLSFRIWDCKTDLDKLFANKIDWVKVDESLDNMRKDSVTWLNDNLIS